MRLSKSRARSVPLELPVFGEFILPDPRVLQDYFEEIEALTADVLQQALDSADNLRPVTLRIVRTMVPALMDKTGGEDVLATDDQSVGSYAYGTALGLCFASQEFQRGWTKDRVIDGRVAAAMTMAQPQGGYGSAYFVRVGYWVGRTGDEGTRMLPGNWS